MNAHEIVAVVLVAPGTSALGGTERCRVPIGGIPSLLRVRRTLAESGIRNVFLVSDEVSGEPTWTGSARCADLETALGTWSSGREILLVRGDLPLLTAATVLRFLDAARANPAGRFAESSGGMAFFRTPDAAAEALAGALRANGADFVDAATRGAETWRASDSDDVRRLSGPEDYSTIARLARRRRAAALEAAGALILDAERTYIDDDVSIGSGAVILPGTHVVAGSTIGAGCSIGPDSWIEASDVEDGATVRYSVLEGARVRARTKIGPFAHLRPGSDVGPDARVGNFVEIKASRLGAGVKAGHLAYIGDADVGAGTNVGAGAITCNYDGTTKRRTVVGEDVFVGTNVSLVAPVSIGDGAFLAAGSTITDDVPSGALAIARARQVNKEPRVKSIGEDT